MSTMTLDEMKLAVCEKLTELFWIHPRGFATHLPNTALNNTSLHCSINWTAEGLQVCHEAEKICKQQFKGIHCFDTWLRVVTHRGSECVKYGKGNTYNYPAGYPVGLDTNLIHGATYEQRLEALCRVWFPERFK